MSIQQSDAEAAAVAVAPRVSLADIEAAIEHRFQFTAGHAIALLHRETVSLAPPEGVALPPIPRSLEILSVCILVMRNGFVVLGKSAPASPENYNVELVHKFAYEDAIRQLWPLMGYALRDQLDAERRRSLSNAAEA